MKIKIAAIFVMVVAVIALAGCTSNADQSSSASEYRTAKVETLSFKVPSSWNETMNERISTGTTYSTMVQLQIDSDNSDDKENIKVFASNTTYGETIEDWIEDAQSYFVKAHESNEYCTYSDIQSSTTGYEKISGFEISVLDMSVTATSEKGEWVTHEQVIYLFGDSWLYTITIIGTGDEVAYNAYDLVQSVSFDADDD